MKIRLMGAPDLVRAWKAALEKSYGIHGAEYPARYGTDIRVYFDLDDRVAAKAIASFQSTGADTAAVARRRQKALKQGAR